MCLENPSVRYYILRDKLSLVLYIDTSHCDTADIGLSIMSRVLKRKIPER